VRTVDRNRVRCGLPLSGLFVVLAGGVGAAALDARVGAAVLGSGITAIAACHETGLTADFVVEGAQVTAVSIGAMDAACRGQTVEVTLATATGPLTRGSAEVRSGATDVTLAAAVRAVDVTGLSLVVAR
jgi:hypothetical protein